MCSMKFEEFDEKLTLLYALIHDVGKPILRYVLRRGSLEDLDSNAEELIKELSKELGVSDVRELSSLRHDKLSEGFLKILLGWVGLDKEASLKKINERKINEIIILCDRASASERGLMPEEEKLREKLWSYIKSVFDDVLRPSGIDYNHHTAPKLTPFWLLNYSNYSRLTGPCAVSDGVSVEDSFISSTCFKVLKNFEGGVWDESSRNLIMDVGKSGFWTPVRSLRYENLLNIKTSDIVDAIKNCRYGEVVGDLYRLSTELVPLYKELGFKITNGFINSLESILLVTTSLVPSAVWATPLPDISLYAHSKTVTALANSVVKGFENPILLRIELNSIQDFISSIVSERAASRVLRGRSLLIELLQDSILKLILNAYDLTKSVVLTSEGGGLTLVIPHTNNLDNIVKYVYDELMSTFRGSLWITFSTSKPFELRGLRGIYDPESMFSKVVKELIDNVVIDKVRAISNKANYILGSKRVREYVSNYMDLLTYDVVYKDDKFSLIVTDENDSYVGLLAPGKLRTDDVLAPGTHLSLVCGSIARNLIAIVTIAVYRKEGQVYVPDNEFIERLVKSLSNDFKESIGSRLENVLIGRVELRPVGDVYYLGLVPFTHLGTIHILISLKSDKLVDYKTLNYGILATVLQIMDSRIKEEFKGESSKTVGVFRKAVIEFKIVNNPENFIQARVVKDSICSLATTLSGLGCELDVEFTPYFLNTYHPISKSGVEGVSGREELRYKDLDEMELVGISKVDVDRLGDVLKLYTYSPSRLVDFSNTLVIAFNMIPYIKLLEFVKSRGEVDVIILYSGGDDVVVYGEWDQVVGFVGDVHEGVIKSLLRPLTTSIACSIGKSKEPILHIYRRVIDGLKIAKGVRNSFFMDLLEPQVIVRCGDGERVVNVIPLDCSVSRVCFESIRKLLNELVIKEKEFAELKSLIYGIARITDVVSKTYGDVKTVTTSSKELDSVRALIYYAYMCVRREDEFKKLKRLMDGIYELPIYPESRLEEVSSRLVEVKPLMNIVILKLTKS